MCRCRCVADSLGSVRVSCVGVWVTAWGVCEYRVWVTGPGSVRVWVRRVNQKMGDELISHADEVLRWPGPLIAAVISCDTPRPLFPSGASAGLGAGGAWIDARGFLTQHPDPHSSHDHDLSCVCG